MIKNFLVSIDIDFEELFTSDVKRDKHIVQVFSAIGYKLNNFFNLRDQYDGSQLRTNRKSELKLKLNKVDESSRQGKCLAASVCNISKEIANLQESAIQVSQSYLKKAEFMQNLLVSLGKLKDIVSNPDLINMCVNKSFIKQGNELINFFLRK